MKNSIRRTFAAFIVLLLCTIIIFGAVPPVKAAAAQVTGDAVTLRVAYYPMSGFFEYDSHGNEVGYGVELLELISQYTGIRFEYIQADSWEKTKQMLLDNEADIRMPGTLPKTPSTTLEYTEHSVIDTYYALMSLNSRDDLFYQDYETFATLRVGISQSLYNSADLEDSLAAVNISPENIVFLDSYNACREALEYGQIDALFSNIMDLDDNMKQLERFSSVSNYISMPIGNPYIDTINSALSEIKMKEPAFISNLYKKWFPERVAIPFTKEEVEYISSLDSLCFSFRDGQGYLSRKDDDGQFIGFYPKVAKMFCQKLGTVYEQTDVTSDEAGKTLIFPDFYYDFNWAEESNVQITQPYVVVNYYEISKKNRHIDLSACTVAAVDGFRVTQDFIGDDFSSDQIVWYKDYRECIDAVLSGEVDITYVNSNTAEYYLGMYRYSNLAFTLTNYSHTACLGVYGDDSGMLVSILNKILTSTSSNELDSILVQATSEQPSQNLFVEWLYGSPVKAVILASLIVFVFALLLAIAVYLQKAKKKNILLLEATSAKQDFLSRMSHDIRTPMNAIIGFSSLGKESSSLEEAHDYHQKINSAGQYLLQLINDTLDLNKLQNGKYELHLEPYTNTDFVESITNILRSKAYEKGVELEITCDKTQPLTVLFDKTRIQQIFVNLLNNAIKFTPSGGHVSLIITSENLGAANCMIHFVVSDDGIGMSENFVKEKLFRPFEQEHSSSCETGTGLGLAIVKDLVATMGGTISCESKLGVGTTFRVDIQSQIVENNVPKKTPVLLNTSLEGKRVLICEDHRINQEILSKLLQKANMLVDKADNGSIALEIFNRSQTGYYCAILMDIRMPVMDGLEATKNIRALPRKDAKTIPIIAMTANTYDSDADEYFKAGMTARLMKPIERTLLYQTLAESIQEARETSINNSAD